ncbi:hypothetical protein DYH09_16610 [bacterium CPR1]|nr:hypothetical protein [bacterium CPR1]
MRWGSGLALVSVLASGAFLATPVGAQDQQAAVREALGGTLGVVDYSNLLKAHPDYERLSQLDQQLAELKQEIEFAPMQDRDDLLRSAQEKYKKELMRAQAEMEAEQAAIAAQMAGLSDQMKARLDAEAAKGSAEMQRELEAYIKKNAPEAAAPAEPVNMPAPLSEQRKNLLLLRERKVQAIKLEVEKVHRDQREAERARIDSEIAAYEDEIMKTHQQEKLNLQLKVQVAKDEAEQADLQAQLEAISDEEERLKDAKRAELEGLFKTFRADSEARQAAETKAAIDKVNREVEGQIGALPASSGDAPPAPRPKQPTITPEIKAMIAKKQDELRSKMEAEAAVARQKMEAEQGAAVARLKTKSEELKARIEKQQEELKKAVQTNAREGLSAATKEKIKVLEEQREKLQTQRSELFDKMVADLKGDIGEVAKKQQIDIVIGTYVENRGCVDLTDYAMVAIKTKARPESP